VGADLLERGRREADPELYLLDEAVELPGERGGRSGHARILAQALVIRRAHPQNQAIMAHATDWKEDVLADEEERFTRYAEQIRDIQRRNAASQGMGRALHAKINIGLEAELTVPGDVPEDARLRLFAEPATYKAWVRFSNGGPRKVSDRKPDIRGVAVKVVGVSDKKIIPGIKDARTQD